MTRNTVAIVSAVLFVVLAALLAVSPVPYVTWNPGATYNVLGSADGQPFIKVDGLQTYPTSGQLLMTTVAQTRVDAQVSLPEALMADWSASSDVLPREWVYQPGKSGEQFQAESTRQMDAAQRDATVAALRAAGHPVAELAMVSAVAVAGPAIDKLLTGDMITKVDGIPVTTVAQVREAVGRHAVGDDVQFELLRSAKPVTVRITTVSSNQDKKLPTIGVSLTKGYQYGPSVTFGTESGIGGPSAGLALALGTFDLITEGDLIGNNTIGVTGTIDSEGNVGKIGGIREKIYGADRAQASAFLVPEANCEDIAGIDVKLRLIKVATLKDAIAALQLIAAPQSNTEVPHC